jgi:hypothetical protein
MRGLPVSLEHDRDAARVFSWGQVGFFGRRIVEMRLLIAAASLLLLGSAHAQTSYSPQDLTGMWFIQVFGYPAPDAGPSDTKDKVADGSITFSKVSEGDYDCTFNITFNFDQSKRYGSAGGWAVETCRATVTDGTITVQSTIVRASSPEYRPDNFQLKIDSGERMTGTMIGESDGRGGPFLVIFRRR